MILKCHINILLTHQWHAFTFPSTHYNDSSPDTSESKNCMLASINHFVPNKGATISSSDKAQCFPKHARKLIPIKVETTNLFHQLTQKHTVLHKQAIKAHEEEILGAGDV